MVVITMMQVALAAAALVAAATVPRQELVKVVEPTSEAVAEPVATEATAVALEL